MSIRKNRRAVMAELLLMADPRGVMVRSDAASMVFDFDSVAALRSWLRLAGLDDPDMLMGEREGVLKDGREYRAMNAYPTWHGWEIYAQAIEYADTGVPLDPQTTEQLTALAVA